MGICATLPQNLVRGGVECEVRKTHCSEDDKERKLDGEEKNKDPAKLGVRKNK